MTSPENAAAPRRRLSRDIAGIFSARVMWALMGMISGVILARQLGPHDRGILALVLLLPSTVVTIAKLGITQSTVYVINRRKFPVERVAGNVVELSLILGCASAVLVWLLRDGLLATVMRPVPVWALALALTRVPLLLLDNYLYGVMQATARFSLYNTRLVAGEALRLVLVVITVGILDGGLVAAVVLYTFVNTVVILSFLLAMRREIGFSFALDWSLLREQLAFGLKSWVQTIAAHLLLRIDLYMVSYFLGAAETAFYALALHLTEMVLEIPQAVGLVLFPRLASLPKNEVHLLTARTCRRMILVTVPCAFALALLGPYVITLWYGAPYAPAGAPLPWAAVGVVMMSLYVIVTRDFTSRNRQQVNITAGVLALAANVTLNLFWIPAYGIVGAAAATAVSYTGACLLLLIFYAIESRVSLVDVVIAQPEDLRYFRELAERAFVRARRLVTAGSAAGR
jgi:O-antigen/teichoic acid export membrane protein